MSSDGRPPSGAGYFDLLPLCLPEQTETNQVQAQRRQQHGRKASAANRLPTQALDHPHRQQSTLGQYYPKHDTKEKGSKRTVSAPTIAGVNRMLDGKRKLQVLTPCLLLRLLVRATARTMASASRTNPALPGGRQPWPTCC